MNIPKNFLFFALLLMAATTISSQATKETPAAITSLDCLPIEVWNQIARELPGSNGFLNRLARHFMLDDSCYKKIIKALLDSIEDMPLVSEIPLFIDRYFKTTHSSAIDAKIENVFMFIVQSHDLSKYHANADSIQSLFSILCQHPERYPDLYTDHIPSSDYMELSFFKVWISKPISALSAIKTDVKNSIMYFRYLHKLINQYSFQANFFEESILAKQYYLTMYGMPIGTTFSMSIPFHPSLEYLERLKKTINRAIDHQKQQDH